MMASPKGKPLTLGQFRPVFSQHLKLFLCPEGVLVGECCQGIRSSALSRINSPKFFPHSLRLWLAWAIWLPVSIRVARGSTRVDRSLISASIFSFTLGLSHLSSSGPQVAMPGTSSQTQRILVSIINTFFMPCLRLSGRLQYFLVLPCGQGCPRP